ncbi:hypothetical protein [Escherichia coli]|uniref:hypothetical protein n=1 Tax=Escherichia coli TaxID=562 RepID=UPI00287B6B96|nr:hypothetical protein [Escherichia coli]WNE26536.1 hypothetical protein RJ650_25220 [Escherichia coli]
MFDAKVTVDGLRAVKPMSEWQLSDNAAYMPFTARTKPSMSMLSNETPDFGKDVVVAAGLLSTILSRPIDVSRYGCNLRWRAEKYRPGWPDNRHRS